MVPDEIKRIGKKLEDYPHQLTTDECLALLLYQAKAMEEWAGGVEQAIIGAVAAPPPPPKWPPA